MKSVNLIPAPRLASKMRRVHLRRCAAACCAWAVVSAVAAGAAHAMWRNAVDPQADERLLAAAEDVERTERAIATAKSELAAAQSTLRANEAIASQPDWSILLAVLARGIGDDVVLRSCLVHPVGGAAGRRPDAPRAAAPPAASSPAGVGASAGNWDDAAPFELEANGIARTLAAAHRFVNDLERTGLFARVTLLDTKSESFMTEGAVAFRLRCSLDEPAAAAAANGNGIGTGTGTGGAQAGIDTR